MDSFISPRFNFFETIFFLSQIVAVVNFAIYESKLKNDDGCFDEKKKENKKKNRLLTTLTKS